jgi:hypothetical protein
MMMSVYDTETNRCILKTKSLERARACVIVESMKHTTLGEWLFIARTQCHADRREMDKLVNMFCFPPDEEQHVFKFERRYLIHDEKTA